MYYKNERVTPVATITTVSHLDSDNRPPHLRGLHETLSLADLLTAPSRENP